MTPGLLIFPACSQKSALAYHRHKATHLDAKLLRDGTWMGWPTKFDAAHDLIDPEMGARQHTLRTAIGFIAVGLHSGRRLNEPP